jgi:hypothetical protein
MPDIPGLGDACDTDAACVVDPYTYCQLTAGGAGYCTTKDCSDSSECTGGYACALDVTPSYCERPPTGQGAACESADDCASFEATYCETRQGHVCLVQGCTLGGNDCFSGWQCCDLSAFLGAVLCIPEGNCPAP